MWSRLLSNIILFLSQLAGNQGNIKEPFNISLGKPNLPGRTYNNQELKLWTK